MVLVSITNILTTNYNYKSFLCNGYRENWFGLNYKCFNYKIQLQITITKVFCVTATVKIGLVSITNVFPRNLA
jgi:hypothetical protein